MKIKNINKVINIIRTIKENKRAVEWLEKHARGGFRFLTADEQCRFADGDLGKIEIYLEDWEILMIIQNKKQRIAELERELEEL